MKSYPTRYEIADDIMVYAVVDMFDSTTSEVQLKNTIYTPEAWAEVSYLIHCALIDLHSFNKTQTEGE